MKPANPTSGAITRCPAQLVNEALNLVFEPLPTELRQSHVGALMAASAQQPLAGLLVSCNAGNLEAALFAQPQPGQVASFWGPAFATSFAGARDSLASALIATGCEWAAHERAELAQTLLSDHTLGLERVYRDAEFSIRAELEYLICPVQRGSANADSTDVQLVQYSEADRALFARLIADTYQGTQDCPELNDVRDMRHVLAGYADAGESGDRYWYVVRHQGEVAGVLLMADHPALDQAELVYMGVLPSARGCGLGKVIARIAKERTQKLSRSRLILAADIRNRAALDIYESIGFRPFDRRTALLRPLNRS